MKIIITVVTILFLLLIKSCIQCFDYGYLDFSINDNAEVIETHNYDGEMKFKTDIKDEKIPKKFKISKNNLQIVVDHAIDYGYPTVDIQIPQYNNKNYKLTTKKNNTCFSYIGYGKYNIIRFDEYSEKCVYGKNYPLTLNIYDKNNNLFDTVKLDVIARKIGKKCNLDAL